MNDSYDPLYGYTTNVGIGSSGGILTDATTVSGLGACILPFGGNNNPSITTLTSVSQQLAAAGNLSQNSSLDAYQIPAYDFYKYSYHQNNPHQHTAYGNNSTSTSYLTSSDSGCCTVPTSLLYSGGIQDSFTATLLSQPILQPQQSSSTTVLRSLSPRFEQQQTVGLVELVTLKNTNNNTTANNNLLRSIKNELKMEKMELSGIFIILF